MEKKKQVSPLFLLHMKYGIGQWMCTENLKLIFKKQFWYFQVFFADMELLQNKNSQHYSSLWKRSIRAVFYNWLSKIWWHCPFKITMLHWGDDQKRLQPSSKARLRALWRFPIGNTCRTVTPIGKQDLDPSAGLSHVRVLYIHIMYEQVWQNKSWG